MTESPISSSEKLLRNPGALCNMVRRVALQAGEIILDHEIAEGGIAVEIKPDGSPVTEADREAEKYIAKALLDLLPNTPFIGEEATARGETPDIREAGYYWLVDALDGTRDFISGGTDYTVNIALIHKHEPLLGVVYAPAKGVLYAGHSGTMAVRWTESSDHEKEISIRSIPKAGLTVMASMRAERREKLDQFLAGYKVEKMLKRGSSLKICAIAEGKADFYPCLGPTSEWDTAAGDAVLRAAGGSITDLNGEKLRYGLQKTFVNPEFVAASFKWLAEAGQEIAG